VHRLWPFLGLAQVAHVPGGRIVAVHDRRVVRYIMSDATDPAGRRLADCELEPKGVGVVIDAEHNCMTLRGSPGRWSADPHVRSRRSDAGGRRLVRSSSLC